MIYISNDSSSNEVINLTRGDDASIEVSLTLDDGTEYDMDSNDYLIFGVREAPTDDSPVLISIESDRGSNTIVFEHDDTNEMDIGTYSAEIQLMTSDGKRYTVWPKLTGNMRTGKSNRKNFVLMTEVVRE